MLTLRSLDEGRESQGASAASVPATPAAEADAPRSLGRHDPTLRSEERGGATERDVGEDGRSPRGGGDVGLLGPAQRRGVHEAQGSEMRYGELNNLGVFPPEGRAVLFTYQFVHVTLASS